MSKATHSGRSRKRCRRCAAVSVIVADPRRLGTGAAHLAMATFALSRTTTVRAPAPAVHERIDDMIEDRIGKFEPVKALAEQTVDRPGREV